ncbi:MAG TPA: hypothetical protein VH165_05260 [Kofleriaceae bacterium]|nr:hypothetical protein [Kofleriaceae bacterium]
MQRPQALRYAATLKKTPRKLVLRSQIVRMLADIDLTRAAGGLHSGNAQCPVAADTGAADCPTWTK